MKAYLAGPMTNAPGFGFRAFDSVAAELRGQGIDIVTPSEMDSPKSRKAALASLDGNAKAYYAATGETRGGLLGRDIRVVIDQVDSVIVLPGWRSSVGARLETYAAWLHGKPILYPALHRVPQSALFSAWLEKGL